jgi:transposase-like protein
LLYFDKNAVDYDRMTEIPKGQRNREWMRLDGINNNENDIGNLSFSLKYPINNSNIPVDPWALALHTRRITSTNTGTIKLVGWNQSESESCECLSYHSLSIGCGWLTFVPVAGWLIHRADARQTSCSSRCPNREKGIHICRVTSILDSGSFLCKSCHRNAVDYDKNAIATTFYGILRHFTAFYGTQRQSTAIYGTLRHATAFYSILQHSTAFSGHLRHDKVTPQQYNTYFLFLFFLSWHSQPTSFVSLQRTCQTGLVSILSIMQKRDKMLLFVILS